MTETQRTSTDTHDCPRSTYELLLQLDLATEMHHGLDGLGLENRSQLEALREQLERAIAEPD